MKDSEHLNRYSNKSNDYSFTGDHRDVKYVWIGGKQWRKAVRRDKRFRRRALLNSYKSSDYLHSGEFTKRSISRLNSSSYWFDFVSGNLSSFIVIFLLLVCISKAVLWANSTSVNPFEDVISILQEFSSMGFQAKDSMVSFVKSLQSIGNSNEILGDYFIFNNSLTRLLASIAYSLSAIFNFLVFIIRCIWIVLRVLVGA